MEQNVPRIGKWLFLPHYEPYSAYKVVLSQRISRTKKPHGRLFSSDTQIANLIFCLPQRESHIKRISSKWSTCHRQMMFLSQELSIQHIFWLNGTPFKLPLPAIYILMRHFRYKEVHDRGWLFRLCPSPAVSLPGALIQMIPLRWCSCEQRHCSTQSRALHWMWPLSSVIHECTQFGALP